MIWANIINNLLVYYILYWVLYELIRSELTERCVLLAQRSTKLTALLGEGLVISCLASGRNMGEKLPDYPFTHALWTNYFRKNSKASERTFAEKLLSILLL